MNFREMLAILMIILDSKLASAKDVAPETD